MIYVGIDAAKDKHDCRILGGNGQMVQETFTFQNNHEGFEQLKTQIQRSSQADGSGQIRAGLESTGHYSSNLEAFLRSTGVELVVFNQLQVNL